MTSKTPSPLHRDYDASWLDEQVAPLARALRETLVAVVRAIPGAKPDAPHTPTPLARQVGMSRVIVSRLLAALAYEDPYETLQRLPGPESLRALTLGATSRRVPKRITAPADAAIDRFARLIREDFGSRSALHSAISSKHHRLHQRVEHASRYEVYKGMRQILGVAAETSLTAMIFAPSATDSEAVDVTTIHGALGMRRLRPEVPVYFTYGPPAHVSRSEGDGTAAGPGERDPTSPPIDLREFYVNAPAPLEIHLAGGQLVHRLAHDRLGKDAAIDMLAVSHKPNGSRRYAAVERPRGGLVAFADMPVKVLVCDAIVHDEIFPGVTPELMVYHPGARGPANPNDPQRDIDRVETPDPLLVLGKAVDRFELPDVPNYRAMLERVFAHRGEGLGRFRVYRLRIPYPVSSFQYVMAFRAPDR